MKHTHHATIITLLLQSQPVTATLGIILPTQLTQPGHTHLTQPEVQVDIHLIQQELQVDIHRIQPELLHSPLLDIHPHKIATTLLQQ